MNPLHPLTIPTYRQLFAAMVLTIFAQGAWALYLAMQTLDLGATPATLSGVVAWSGIGLLAGSLPAGVLADRIPNKSVIVGVLTLNCIVATATSTAAILDLVTFWMLAVSAFISGASTAFFFPAYTALVPVLVDSDDLMAVNGLEGATRPLVGQALAPAVVGALIGGLAALVGAVKHATVDQGAVVVGPHAVFAGRLGAVACGQHFILQTGVSQDRKSVV